MSYVLTQTALRGLVDRLIGEGVRVAGPRRIRPDLILYSPLAESAQLLLEDFVRPGNSIKEFFFPRHEVLYRYRMSGRQIELSDPQPLPAAQVILAARPCDAAALPILDHVFNWDYQDAFFNARRASATVVTLACRGHDRHCFCTSLGLSPADPRGSDAMLFDLGDGAYEVRWFTPKGERLFAGAAQPSDRTGTAHAGPPPALDRAALDRFLEDGFENPLWQKTSLRCLGCGACAYHCPSCHCFDIQDEGTAAGSGVRVRHWDTCQLALYSKHASGHNPRSSQDQRQRNRIYHKFRTYPEKFGETLCTGCGNCTRACPVSLGVRPVLEAIEEASRTGAVAAAD